MQPLVLKPGKAKPIILVLFCLMFVFAGVSLVRLGNAMGWLIVCLFGVCGAVLAAQLLPQASYLELHPDGFVACALFRPWNKLAWTDVADFSIVQIAGRKYVGFNYSSSYKQQAQARAAAQAVGGAEAMLPDTYGLRAEDLARLLNEWRNGDFKV